MFHYDASVVTLLFYCGMESSLSVDATDVTHTSAAVLCAVGQRAAADCRQAEGGAGRLRRPRRRRRRRRQGRRRQGRAQQWRHSQRRTG